MIFYWCGRNKHIYVLWTARMSNRDWTKRLKDADAKCFLVYHENHAAREQLSKGDSQKFQSQLLQGSRVAQRGRKGKWIRNVCCAVLLALLLCICIVVWQMNHHSFFTWKMVFSVWSQCEKGIAPSNREDIRICCSDWSFVSSSLCLKGASLFSQLLY